MRVWDASPIPNAVRSQDRRRLSSAWQRSPSYLERAGGPLSRQQIFRTMSASWVRRSQGESEGWAFEKDSTKNLDPCRRENTSSMVLGQRPPKAAVAGSWASCLRTHLQLLRGVSKRARLVHVLPEWDDWARADINGRAPAGRAGEGPRLAAFADFMFRGTSRSCRTCSGRPGRRALIQFQCGAIARFEARRGLGVRIQSLNK